MSLVRAWMWLGHCGSRLLVAKENRRLRLADTLSLGEKRFISIVQVDAEQFLLGVSASGIVLLAKLDGGRSEYSEAPAPETSFAKMLATGRVPSLDRGAERMDVPFGEQV